MIGIKEDEKNFEPNLGVNVVRSPAKEANIAKALLAAFGEETMYI